MENQTTDSEAERPRVGRTGAEGGGEPASGPVAGCSTDQDGGAPQTGARPRTATSTTESSASKSKRKKKTPTEISAVSFDYNYFVCVFTQLG